MASASRKNIPTPALNTPYGEDVEGGERPMPPIQATRAMNTRITPVAEIDVPQPGSRTSGMAVKNVGVPNNVTPVKDIGVSSPTINKNRLPQV